jgi:hypothetical protein
MDEALAVEGNVLQLTMRPSERVEDLFNGLPTLTASGSSRPVKPQRKSRRACMKFRCRSPSAITFSRRVPVLLRVAVPPDELRKRCSEIQKFWEKEDIFRGTV